MEEEKEINEDPNSDDGGYDLIAQDPDSEYNKNRLCK